MYRLILIAISVLLCRLNVFGENIDHLTPMRGVIFEDSHKPAYWLRVQRTLIESRPEPGKALVRVFMPAPEIYRKGEYSGESLFTLYFVGDWDRDQEKGSYLLEKRNAEKSMYDLKSDTPVAVEVYQMPVEHSLGLRILRIWRRYLLETRYPKRLIMQWDPTFLHSCVMPEGDTYCGATPNGYAAYSKMYHLDRVPYYCGIWLQKGAADVEFKARFLDALDQLEK